MPDLLPLLLDDERVSALVDRPVRAVHLRPKPGVSHTAALVAGDHRSGDTRLAGSAEDRPGWIHVLHGDARDKADKLCRQGAVEGGEVHRVEIPDADALVLYGRVESDPRLAPRLARAGLVEEVRSGRAVVLRYNPLRRLVLRVGDHVVRVTAEETRDRLRGRAALLATHDVPASRYARAREVGRDGGRHVTFWHWVEGPDLATATAGDPGTGLRRTGDLLARLHAVPFTDGDTDALALSRRGVEDLHAAAAAAADALRRLAPEVAQDVDLALDRLTPGRLPRGEELGADVLLHGDFSLDQCFLHADGVVLGDLDRMAVGPAVVDLAQVHAVALLEGQDLTGMLDGYRAAGGSVPAPEVLGPVVAVSLLARVAEPWRSRRPDWVEETRRLLALVLSLLPPAWQVPGTVEEMEGDGAVQVARAWPDKVVDGVPRVAVEGLDEQGRLRAGTVDRNGRVRLQEPGRDRRLPHLSAALDGAGRSLVVHRSGRRAVVAAPQGYLKVVRPGRAADVVRAASAGQELCRRVGLGAAVPTLLDEGTVCFSVVPGRAAHDLADTLDAPGWARLWERWAECWTALQSCDPDGPAGHGVTLPRHGVSEEAGVLRTWALRSARAGVLDGSVWLRRLHEVAGELDRQADTRLVPGHRDLHDKQLLWDGADLGVIDFDTASLVPPELDPVNLLVHARLRGAQGIWGPGRAAVVREAVGSVLEAGGATGEAVALFRRATLARLVAVYAFRPRWREQIHAWAAGEWCRESL